MRKPEADAWMLETLQHIDSQSPFETTHIELKRQLVPAKEFARQLAGLANAARWAPVLLLIGVDRSGICGVAPFELGDWYAELRAAFEFGHAPALAHQNFIDMGGRTIAGIVFETDNPPYVIGGKQGGPREIPWRFGSNTGTAGRSELLSILLPRAYEPEVEVVGGEILLLSSQQLQCNIEAFIAPQLGSPPVMIPNHRIEISVSRSRA